MTSTASPIVSLRKVSRRYGDGDTAVWAVRDVSLDLQPGELVSLTGPSGSGKSTLLHLVAGLDTPTGGEVLVDGRAVASLSDRDLARMRRRTLALVFQFFNLLPTLTARENVAVPLRADRLPPAEVAARVERALVAVGIAHRAGHFPHQMSGGEMQRVAIARALATEARLILADEPTGNLDSARGEEILELLKQTTEAQGRTVLLVTHDLRAAAYGDRMITLRDGSIVDEVLGPRATSKVTPLRRP
jgi:putative ABC transport system ATP-binding protein